MERITEKQAPDVLTGDGENHTVIPVDEAPPHKQQKFRRFRHYNTGMWNGPKRENTEAARKQNDLQRFDAIASSVGLTDYQKSRGRKIVERLDFGEAGPVPADHIFFGVCVAVANADIEGGTRYWPHPDASNDELFAEMADDLGIDLSKQMSVVQWVKARTGL